VKRYEGLFILNTAGKDEGVQDIIDKIRKELESAGCKMETVQKMDKRNFMRVADKKHNAGFYVNYIFEAEPEIASQVRSRFTLNEDVFRVLISKSPAPKPVAAAAVAAN
jgi:small subunit ribosomal protein S6